MKLYLLQLLFLFVNFHFNNRFSLKFYSNLYYLQHLTIITYDNNYSCRKHINNLIKMLLKLMFIIKLNHLNERNRKFSEKNEIFIRFQWLLKHIQQISRQRLEATYYIEFERLFLIFSKCNTAKWIIIKSNCLLLKKILKKIRNLVEESENQYNRNFRRKIFGTILGRFQNSSNFVLQKSQQK